jgi:hypothetical protein
MKIIAMLGLLFCGSAFGAEGLVVHFSVKKSDANVTSTYANGLLMRLTEVSTQTFPGLYEMRVDARALNDGEVKLVLTLKDLSSGKPVYAGSAGTTLKVGASQTLSFHQLADAKVRYEVFVDTSYAQLPESAN